jgi:hypothetical protein
MPIKLETPLAIPSIPGQNSATYEHVSIRDFRVNLFLGSISIVCAYGNTVDGKWHGAVGVKPITVFIADRDAHIGPGNVGVEASYAYSELLKKTTVPKGSEGKPIYGLVKQSLYDYLIETVPEFLGTIV